MGTITVTLFNSCAETKGRRMVDLDKLEVVYCVHCGRIYVLDEDMGDECSACGIELYPVRRKFELGELRLADGALARVEDSSHDFSCLVTTE